MNRISQGREQFLTQIIPVLREPVEVFKVPPKEGTSRKQSEKVTRLSRQQTTTDSPKGDRINKDHEGGPKRRKGIILEWMKPPRTPPGQGPETEYKEAGGPTPPRKRALVNGGTIPLSGWQIKPDEECYD